jgi:hypothetical protein
MLVSLCLNFSPAHAAQLMTRPENSAGLCRPPKAADIREAPDTGGWTGASGSVWGEPVNSIPSLRDEEGTPITSLALYPLCPVSNTSDFELTAIVLPRCCHA